MSTAATKAIARRYFEEVVNQQHVDRIDDLFGPELRDFTRANVGRIHAAFPDAHFTILDQVAEDDKVATVWVITGTHRGQWASPMGSIAPTHTSVRYTGTTTLRVADGKIVEVIGTNHDHLGLLQQLGALPAPAPRSGG